MLEAINKIGVSLLPFIITGGVTLLVSLLILNYQMRKQARNLLYLDEVKQIKDIARVASMAVNDKEYVSGEHYHRGKLLARLTLNDKRIRKLWEEYAGLICDYNNAYSKLKSEDPYEHIPLPEEKVKIHEKYYKAFDSLFAKLNKRIEDFIAGG